MDLFLIVCPIEFSASGEAALRRALALAQWHEAALHVLYVRPGRARRTAVNATSIADPFRERLVTFISSLNHQGVAVTPVVLTGDPVKAVAEYACVNSADLVVVGQNGRRGSRFWSAGVLAADVARAVPCSTFTVSEESVSVTDLPALFNNILVGIDFSAASLRALKVGLTMAQQSGGRITLLHVLDGFPYEAVYSGSRAFELIAEYHARVEKAKRELRALVPQDALNWCEVENRSRIRDSARCHSCRCDGAKRRSRGDRAPAANQARSNRDGIDGLSRAGSCPVSGTDSTWHFESDRGDFDCHGCPGGRVRLTARRRTDSLGDCAITSVTTLQWIRVTIGSRFRHDSR